MLTILSSTLGIKGSGKGGGEQYVWPLDEQVIYTDFKSYEANGYDHGLGLLTISP